MERAQNTEHNDTGERPRSHDVWSELDELLGDGRFDDADDLVRSRWFDFQTEPPDRGTALSGVPAGVIDERPLLAALLGREELASPSLWARGANRVARLSAAKATSPLDRAILLAAQVELHRTLGRADDARAAGRAAVLELEAIEEPQVLETETASGLYAQVGASLLYSGAETEALEALELGLAFSAKHDLPASPATTVVLAAAHVWNGDSVEAREHIHAARSQAWLLQPDDLAVLQVAEALVTLDALDPASAHDRLADSGIEVRTTSHWVPYAVAAATVQLVSGYPGRGLALLDQHARARGREARSEAARAALAPLRAVLELALGHQASAAEILGSDAGSDADRRIGTARVELAVGRHGAALQQLRLLTPGTMSLRRRAEASALEAAALLRFSRERRVMAVVDHLGATLQRSGLLLPLALLPGEDLVRVSAALGELGYGETLPLTRIRSLLPDAGRDDTLTRRETAVLVALLDHSSHTAIAAQLNVSVNTVKSQLRSVYRKLGVSTRDQAIAIALDRHLYVERE